MRIAAAAIFLAFAAAGLAADPPPGRTKALPCAACHGVLGISVAPDAPNLAGQPAIYLAAQLKAFRDGKRSHDVMNLIAKPLTDDDITQLAEWYAAISVEAKVKP